MLETFSAVRHAIFQEIEKNSLFLELNITSTFPNGKTECIKRHFRPTIDLIETKDQDRLVFRFIEKDWNTDLIFIPDAFIRCSAKPSKRVDVANVELIFTTFKTWKSGILKEEKVSVRHSEYDCEIIGERIPPEGISELRQSFAVKVSDIRLPPTFTSKVGPAPNLLTFEEFRLTVKISQLCLLLFQKTIPEMVEAMEEMMDSDSTEPITEPIELDHAQLTIGEETDEDVEMEIDPFSECSE